jgi:hypothetical protein
MWRNPSALRVPLSSTAASFLTRAARSAPAPVGQRSGMPGPSTGSGSERAWSDGRSKLDVAGVEPLPDLVVHLALRCGARRARSARASSSNIHAASLDLEPARSLSAPRSSRRSRGTTSTCALHLSRHSNPCSCKRSLASAGAWAATRRRSTPTHHTDADDNRNRRSIAGQGERLARQSPLAIAVSPRRPRDSRLRKPMMLCPKLPNPHSPRPEFTDSLRAPMRSRIARSRARPYGRYSPGLRKGSTVGGRRASTSAPTTAPSVSTPSARGLPPAGVCCRWYRKREGRYGRE